MSNEEIADELASAYHPIIANDSLLPTLRKSYRDGVLAGLEAAQQSVQADSAVCAECHGVDGYHSTGCTNWLWQPPSR